MIYNIFFILLLFGALFCAWHISYADFRRRIIPDVYLFPLLLIGLILINYFPWPITLAEGAIAAASGYVLALIIGKIFVFAKRKSNSIDTPIGMGDIKLISVGGLWLGVTGLSLALVFACLTGGIWGLVKKQKFIPFAPFFLVGGILSLIIIMFLI